MRIVYRVVANFEDKSEAVTFLDWAKELNVDASLSRHKENLDTGKGQSKTHEQRLGKLVLNFMKADPNKTFDVEEIEIFCEESDYKRASAAAILSGLVRDGVIRRVGTGLYRYK